MAAVRRPQIHDMMTTTPMVPAVTRIQAQQVRARATEADARWAQVRARDASADGVFVYSVATTGVYCRPSCASRPARPENVAFHATPAG